MGAVDTTYTFTATDTITSTKMNNIIDQTTMTSDAIIGTTLDVASGKLKVRALGITSNEIADGEVTSDKIRDGTIVNADINASAEIAPSKLGSGALPAGATITTSNIVDASITAPKLNGAQTGPAPIYGARAWVNFDATVSANLSGTVARSSGSTTARVTITNHGLLTGHKVFIDFASGITDNSFVVTKVDDDNFDITTGASTPVSGVAATISKLTIRSSGNVSSVSRVSTGNFIVNFTNPMQGSNYTGLFNSYRFAYFDRSQSSDYYASVQTDDITGSSANYAINNFIVFE